MSSSPLDLGADELLSHGRFLRRLARRLVRNEAEAEDLVQDAWATALERPPVRATESGSLRAWLARTLRHRAISRRRQDSRRRAREEGVARSEPVGGGDVVEELDLQERVVRAVQGLAEPYRSTIWLRYYRGRGPKQIAKEQGVPVSTVDTRLQRARAKLREQLDAEFNGDRGAWVSALLPFAISTGPGVVDSLPEPLRRLAELGAPIMGTKLKILLAATAAAGLVAVLGTTLFGPAAGPDPELATARSETLRLPEIDGAVEPRSEEFDGERRVVSGSAPGESPADEEVAPAGAAFDIACRVLDLEGAEVIGARILFHPRIDLEVREPLREGTTDGTGRFTFPGIGTDGVIRAHPESGLATVLEGTVLIAQRTQDPTLVVAPAIGLRVRVSDEAGMPVANARLSLSPPETLRALLPQVLDASLEHPLFGTADADGLFETPGAPALPGARLEVWEEGYVRHREVLADPLARAVAGILELEVTLRAAESSPRAVAGRVLDEAGRGLADVLVCCGEEQARTDARGTFFLARRPEHAVEVLAILAGYLPARRELAGLEPDEEIVLQLAEPSRTISGRVVDLDGNGVPSAFVFPSSVSSIGGFEILERHLAGQPGGRNFHGVVTDDAGGFDLIGLLDGEYEIGALDPASLLKSDGTVVEAGAVEVEITLDVTDVWTRVTGRIVDRHGVAVEGAEVEPHVPTQSGASFNSRWSTGERREAVRTDEEGRFHFRDLARRGVVLHVSHPDIVPRFDVALPPAEREDAAGEKELTEVTVTVELRYRFQVVLRDPREADEMRILDEHGEELEPRVQKSRSTHVGDYIRRLNDGRSEHVFVEAPPAAIVLFRDGEEVRREFVNLEPRRANVVEL